MAAEFKIGRLRFNWAGAWTPASTYARDDVVNYQGKTYVCLVPNTSDESNFYNDLNHSPYPYWNLVVDGKTFVGTWITGQLYSLGNLAIFGGKVYVCTTAHTSTAFADDTNNWAEYAEFTAWHPLWTINTNYGLNDVVRWGGIVYECIANHTSASSLSIGLEANQSAWKVYFSGVDYRGAWVTNHRYKLNDLIKLDADIYICVTYHISSNIFDSGNWAIWLPGYKYSGIWSSNTTYQPGDTSNYGGYVYVSNTQNNIGNTPSTDSTDWTLFNKGYEFDGNWNNSTAYKLGSVVLRNGVVYIAVSDNNGQDPSSYSVLKTYTASGSSGTTLKVSSTSGISIGMNIVGKGFTAGQSVVKVTDANTLVISKSPDGVLTNGQSLSFVGINYVYWSVLLPGTFWKKTWSNGTSYVVGDIAVWQNGTYVCIQTHIASSVNNNRPDLDTANVYWIFYIPHARKNALNTYGDLEIGTGNPNKYTAVPIGTPTYVLRNTGGTPTWSVINVVPQVFYVSTSTGQDIPTYGKSWDQPWKTIQYATQIVGAGTNYPNAVALLKANKFWLTTEMYQWMLYQQTNNISPFTVSSVFDQTKTIRDAGYVIDALVYDLSRGGNSQTVAAALAYFAFGSNSTLFDSAITTEINYFIASLNYLTTLVGSALSLTPPSTSYQTLNGFTPLVYQQTLLPSAELGSPQQAATLLGIITTALTTQNISAIPSPNNGITASIFVKTGTYAEVLPISVPENTVIYGDELRGVIVEPATSITTTTTACDTSLFTVASTTGLTDQMPVQFVAPNISSATGTTYTGFGGITPGQTYYVVGSSITSTKFSVASSPRTIFNGTLTSGSNIITDIINITGLAVGASLSGTGVGDQATILSINVSNTNLNANTVTMSVSAILNVSNASITSTGTTVTLTPYSGGSMTVYAGDCLKDMFRLRNGTGLRNMTLTGLLGTLSNLDNNYIQRPTGGSFAALDPGQGPNDTSVWIFRRSPYIQNVTAFGNGCAGYKVDGNLHNGGNRSIVANDFTHIVNDGIGIWCTGPNALTEAVSVFSYYGYAGYFAENGGRIRGTNGNSSYGRYGVIAEGYDSTEIPGTGIIFNQSSQVQATVQQSYGTNSQLLRIEYSNCGSGYTSTTTNLLNYSNNFLGASWSSDTNVGFNKINLAPTGNTEAWTLVGASAGPDGSYVYQNVSIPPTGAVYTGVTATNIPPNTGGTGSNSPATFNITVTSTVYIVTVQNPGGGYTGGNQLYIPGSQLGGVNSVNDCVLTVTGLSGSGIQSVSVSGTVPAGSANNYTLSLYVKQGTAPSVDIYGIFSGTNTLASGINFNFNTGIITANNTAITGTNSGFLPVQYGVVNQQISSSSPTAGWYRIWFAINDTSGLNNQLQFRIYPKGYTGTAGLYSFIYGSQIERSTSSFSPSFYLEVATTSKYTAYANFNIQGSGTGVITIGDEIRSGSIFQTRVNTDSNGVTGGAGYLTASNNAQSGTDTYVQLAQSDTNTNGNYTGMRVFINSGTGAGQYGYIAYYNSTNKYAYVLKESFTPLQITNTTTSGSLLTLGSGYGTNTLYINQPVQFIPTYYTTAVTSTALSSTSVTSATGGVYNTFTVNSTNGLYVNMPVTFSVSGLGQAIFSDVTAGYQYYIFSINPVINGVPTTNTIQITQQSYGVLWTLNTVASGLMTMNFSSNNSYIQGPTTNMIVNYPIQFTGTALGGLNVGTVYYIQDIIDNGNFTIAGSLVTVTITSTTADPTDTLNCVSTSSLIPLNPIIFTNVGDVITDSQKYYISNIVSSGSFNITNSLITVIATVTYQGVNANLITVSSTAGFVQNQPIQFVGQTFGNIQAEQVYYIGVISGDGVTFTVTQSPGGQSVPLATATGSMTVRTCPTPLVLTGATGLSMVGVSTSTKTSLSLGIGAMNGTFSTTLFGGVSLGQTYYINSIPTPGTGGTITVSLSQGIGNSGSGSPVALNTKSGSMNLAALGWDHINIGTPIANPIDNTSVYFIEPRTTYTAPVFGQTATTSTAYQLSSNVYYTASAYGNGLWMAVPSANATGAYSTDGILWTSAPLPSSANWTGVAYGNTYWVIISSAGAGSNSVAAVSKANGSGWTTTTLPGSPTTWSNLTYGNGVFVAIANSGNSAAYSTDYGLTWNASYFPTSHTFTATGNARISTSQYKFGSASLYLDGTSNTYIQSPSNADYVLGSGDFTIECWVYRTGNAGVNQVLIDFRTSGASAVAPTLYLNTTYVPIFLVNGSSVITGSAAIPLSTWTHIAISKTSGSTTMWVGGAQSGSTYTDSNSYIQGPITVGANPAGSSYFSGYIDEIRIVKGAGKYTSLFNPSTTSFVSDGSTIVLLHFDGVNSSTTITSSDGSTAWTSLTYGNGKFVAIASTSGSPAASPTRTSGGTVGTNSFVVSSASNISAGQIVTGIGIPTGTYVSSSYTSGTTIPLVNLAGNNQNFVATATGTYSFYTPGGTVAAVSTNGVTWTSSSLPLSAVWASITYGNNMFIAVSPASAKSAYTFNGITWYTSNLTVAADKITYGQGVFLATSSASTTAYITEGGIGWNQKTLTNDGYGVLSFGYNSTANITTITITNSGSGYLVAPNITITGGGATIQATASCTISNGSINAITILTSGSGYTSTPTISVTAAPSGGTTAVLTPTIGSLNIGVFTTLAGRGTASIIAAGARAKGRAQITSGSITGITVFEPGSNYTQVPTCTFTDPNNTTLAVVQPRIGNGALSSPTFYSNGTGYNTASTSVILTGNGYSDSYQTGLTIIMNGLTRLPQPGDNLTISGISQIYKVTNAYGVYSTSVPNLEANVSLSPSVTTANATANGTTVSVRSKYSQVRLTNHDFLNIGYGDQDQSNYPGIPDAGYSALANQQVVEVNYGRVFFTSTDQDGNFKVGNLFGVQQSTGIVTLSASQFGLTGLNSLSLGGISVGGSSVTVTQFGTDPTFTANSDNVLPTQKSIKSYLTSRLSQGGSNTFTGQTTAGTVVIGGSNFIRSTLPAGVTGSVVKVANKVYINANGVDGNMAALDFFMRNSYHRN